MAEKMEMDAEVLTEEEDDSDESNKEANLINSSNKRLKRRPVTFPTTRPSRLTGNFHKLLVQRGIIKPTEKKTSKRVSDGSAVRTKRTGKLSEYQPLPLNTCNDDGNRFCMNPTMIDEPSAAALQEDPAAFDGVHQSLIQQYTSHQSSLLSMTVDAVNQYSEYEINTYRPKTWQERDLSAQNSWKIHRPKFLNEFVCSLPLVARICDWCNEEMLVEKAVRCLSLGCNMHLCSSCDLKIHKRQVFHHRVLLTKTSQRPLLPSEFFDSLWEKQHHDVTLPCFRPASCPKCKKLGTLVQEPQSESSATVIVVTPSGRFDLKLSRFSCLDEECRNSYNASIFDYTNSGFRPPNPEVGSYLFSVENFKYWFHRQHLRPGSSQNKYLEILGKISRESGRSSTINRTLFSRAYREWEFQEHTISVDIQLKRKMYCSACGDKPRTGSADGCVKLRRLESAGRVTKKKNEIDLENAESLYGEEAIKGEEAVKILEEKIDEKVPRSTKKEMCGGSVFKAARSNSSKFKNSDETGVIFSPCRHGSILAAINMHRGETFIHTLLMHIECMNKGCQIFCNDVICRYWIFAKRVAAAFPEYSGLTRMGRMCPRMHVEAHQWWCQVLYNPHWQRGAAATMGEEHEQAFSHFYLYANSTKHMTAEHRNAHLTAGIYYWNDEKFEGMSKTLVFRLKRARVLVKSYWKDLKLLLNFHALPIEDISKLEQELIKAAQQCAMMKISQKTELEILKKNLEGLYVHLKLTKIKIKRDSENAKDRTRLRRIQTALREKVTKNIKLINQHLPAKSKITEESFDEGKFPWQLDILDAENSSSSHPDLTFDEKYKLVNTWMLWNRYKEEIVLTKSEMLQHTKSLKATASALEQKERLLMAEMSNKDSPESEVNTLLLGKVLLIRAEMDYIRRMMNEAANHFRVESEADILCLSLGLKGHEDIRDEEDEKEDETDDPDSTAASVDEDCNIDSGSEDELDLFGSEDGMDIIEDGDENVESTGKADVQDDLLL